MAHVFAGCSLVGISLRRKYRVLSSRRDARIVGVDTGDLPFVVESDDIDDLLAVDVREPAVRPPVSTGPTMEQLGSTVEIDGADSADAELELEVPSELEVRADQDDLELEIPDGSSTVGTYDASLAPPPTAAADLARMDAKYSSTPEAPGGTQAEPAAASEADAHSVRRHSAPTGVSPAKFSTTAEPISVASFSELLDRSIALGK